MTRDFSEKSWALILGGSSGFGLATARKLAEHGMNLAIVHRDRRSAMKAIEPEFEKLRGLGVEMATWNVDAIDPEKRALVLDELATTIGSEGRIRVLLHSVAFGNLKLIAPEKPQERTAGAALAQRLGVDPEVLVEAADALFAEGEDGLHPVTHAAEYPSRAFLDEDDFARTILSMGTSLLGWTQEAFERGLFADDTRIFGLTSEGNEVAWKGYAAVSAAKVSLEALARSIAVEFGPYGIRCNVIQAGITDTPALKAIPGSNQLKAQARLRNPGRRLTVPSDVSNVIYLLSRDEAAWINGEVIRVDGGEHISRSYTMTLYVHGLGHFHPENEITNKFLESLDIGTSDEWIMERVGIRSRRTVLPLDYIRETKNLDMAEGARVNVYDNGQLGARAAQLAVERAGISLSDIGMVIGGGSVPYSLSPVDAANIAVELGIEVPVIDINSACTSFFAGMRMLSMMREDELPEYVLLVATDAMTRSIDYTDRASAVLWGDAAAAAVVSTKVPAAVEVVTTSLTSSPAGRDKVFVPRFGHFDQEGRTVQMFAIRKTSALLGKLIAEYTEDGSGLHFVGHQANLRMLESVCARCDIPPDRHHSNAEFYGNTGAASAASVISMRWGKWQAGDQIAVVGVGAGLTWASFLLRFNQSPAESSQ